jgi:bacteriocin biosynthesis cyclodehydratase domain-containing protein
VHDSIETGLDLPLRIAEGLDVVVVSDNEVLVQFGSRSCPSQLLRDTDLTGLLGRVFGRLQQGGATRNEILSLIATHHRDEAAKLVDSLREQGILARVDESAVEQYLGYSFTGDTRLADYRVSLIGAGPVGAQAAELLLQHGIGGVNLLEGRQPDAVWRALPRANGPGQPGAAALPQVGLRDHLRALGYAGVDAMESRLDDRSLADAVARSDLVVVALEQPDIRLAHTLNRLCITSDRRWIHAVIDGSSGVIGPLFVPGVTACYNDFRALADAANPSPLMARVYHRYAAERGARTFSPGLPAHAGIVAGFISLAAIHSLLLGTSWLLGRVMTINFDRMLIDVEDVLKLPRCPVCGRQRSVYRAPFSAEVVTRVPATQDNGSPAK